MNPNKSTVIAKTIVLIGLSLHAQGSDTRISPVALATVSYKDSYIKITYGQPSKRKRQIFGGLVPYNEVWRTGANEATEITFTRDVRILGKTIQAGTYSLFTIPNPTEWIIILNKDVGLWGAYNYNSRQDYYRWNVPVKKYEDKLYERLTIAFNERNNQADLNICWDDICVTMTIEFNEPKK
jgi:hypothetical protein